MTEKHVGGISPNLVHSLDATHLMKTVNACFDAGVTSMVTVHDSFGVHAANVDLMGKCLREQFHNMYTESDPLGEFLEAVTCQVPEEFRHALPKKLEVGTFDPDEVLNSLYIFS